MAPLPRSSPALLAVATLLACAAPTAQAPRSSSPAETHGGPLSEIREDLDHLNDSYRKELGGRSLYVLAKAQARFFVAPARCGQGPYEIRIPADDTDYQELVSFYALSPRALRGWFEDGRVPWMPPRTFNFNSDRPDNQRCVLTAAEEAAAKRAAAAGGRAPPPGSAATRDGSGRDGSAGKIPPGPATALREIPPPASLPRAQYYMFVRGNWGGTRYPSRYRDPKGDAELVVRIWFDAPNDLEGVIFVAEHATAQLAVPEADLRALIRARSEDAERDQREHEVDVEQYRARHDYCEAHHDDQGCWPRGYDRMMAERAEAQRELAASVRRQEAEAKRREEEAKLHPPPPPDKPDRAPPAAQQEAQPPRPSTNATWLAGYWHWVEGRWLWLGGRWRVPPADITRDLTIHAPTPPPAPRVEPAPLAPTAPPAPPTQPVQPARSAPPARPAPPAQPPVIVWTPGFWQWDGARWVWVAGVWQMPPEPAATWTPDRWQPRAGGAVFVPGGWKVRLRAAPR